MTPKNGGKTGPRPSTAHRWVGGGCTASIRLSQGQPDQTGPWAEEGQRLHAVAAAALLSSEDPEDPDDARLLRPYLADVRAVKTDLLLVEHQLATPRAAHMELEGTPDCVAINFSEGLAVVWDLKTGWGPVEVVENWQLLCYAVLVVWQWEVRRIELRIVQPRPYHQDGPIRTWAFRSTALEPYYRRIRAALEEIRDGGKLRVGAHCRYCVAAARCPALREAALAAVDYSGVEDPVDLPEEHLASELQALRRAHRALGLRVTALEERIFALLRTGKIVPRASIARNRGRRVWTREPEEVLEALALFTGRDFARIKPPTPLQAEKEGAPPEVLRHLSKYEPGAARVVLGDSAAQKVFRKEGKEK